MALPTTTVANLQTLILSWLDDPNAGYFTSANTITWINMAMREVQKQLIMAGENYYVQTSTTLTVSGQAQYVLPNDFLKEHRIEVIQSGSGSTEVRQALSEITINQQDFIPISLGNPVNYYLQKNSVFISPTPSVSNLVVRLYYSYRAADVVATSDICDIPEEFQEYIALLAAYNGFIKDDRSAENLNGKILEYKERLKQMAEDRTQDTGRGIVITDEFSSTGWF